MDERNVADTSRRAGRREWIGLAVLALPTLLIALDIGVLFLALPHLSADLGASGTQQLWITDTYGFLLAGFLIIMGNLGDRVGRRKLLLIGAAAFAGASALAAYSQTPEMLIGARALLGVAGATLGPSTLALISNMFTDARQRGIAISIWAACQFGGGALGPVLGGMLLDHFWWGSVFLLGVPVMLLLLAAGPALLPEYRPPSAGPIDTLSVVWYLGAVLPAVYGIKEIAVGDGSVSAVIAIAAGSLAGALFLRRQRRLEHPMVDLGLFGTPSFRTVLVAMTLGSGALAGVSLMTSQYVQSVAGLTPAAAGVWQAPTGLGIAVGVLLAPILVTRVAPATAIVLGLAISTASMLVLARVDSADALVLVAVCIALAALGLGPLFALGTGLVVSSAPPERAGSAASLSETVNVLGSTLGLALLGTVGTAVYRTQFDQTAPDGAPAAARDAAAETIGGAAAAAEHLPSALAEPVLDAARAAFTTGVSVVAVVGAVVMLAVAVAIRIGQRRGPTQIDNLSTVDAPSS